MTTWWGTNLAQRRKCIRPQIFVVPDMTAEAALSGAISPMKFNIN
jgi:hypothetical protein